MADLTPSSVLVGITGLLRIAPVGTTAPTTPTATPGVAWKSTGLVTTAGPKLSADVTTKEIRAWQSKFPVRVVAVDGKLDLEVGLMEWNSETVALSFGGGVVVVAAGIATYEVPDAEVQRVAALLDINDGAKNYRWLMKDCIVSGGVSTNFQRDDSSNLPVKLSAQKPSDGSATAVLLTDDPGFV